MENNEFKLLKNDLLTHLVREVVLGKCILQQTYRCNTHLHRLCEWATLQIWSFSISKRILSNPHTVVQGCSKDKAKSVPKASESTPIHPSSICIFAWEKIRFVLITRWLRGTKEECQQNWSKFLTPTSIYTLKKDLLSHLNTRWRRGVNTRSESFKWAVAN